MEAIDEVSPCRLSEKGCAEGSKSPIDFEGDTEYKRLSEKVWKFDRFARSVSHLLNALDEFNHLGIRFISVQDQVDTQSPMGKAMFTIIGAMAELESSLISERVKAGMESAKSRGKRLGRPATPSRLVARVEELARTTDMSIRQIEDTLKGRVSWSVIGEIVKGVRNTSRAETL